MVHTFILPSEIGALGVGRAAEIPVNCRGTGNLRLETSSPVTDCTATLNTLISLNKMLLRDSRGSAPFCGRWSTAKVRHLSIKSENRRTILWRQFRQYGFSSCKRTLAPRLAIRDDA